MSNEPEISHILGVDYGASKVGLAIADSETRIAFRYGTLENNKQLFQKLAEIIEKEGVSKVIVGTPSYVNNEKKEDSYADFGKALNDLVPNVEIEFESEMFTTIMAQANLIEKGVKSVKKHDDEEAARIILQSWLDQK
jgi:putative Holliday junction resolvase